MREEAVTKPAMAIVGDARHARSGKHFVHRVEPSYSVVNRSAPELFPAMCLVKNVFIRRETEDRRAFDRTGVSPYKFLKLL